MLQGLRCTIPSISRVCTWCCIYYLHTNDSSEPSPQSAWPSHTLLFEIQLPAPHSKLPTSHTERIDEVKGSFLNSMIIQAKKMVLYSLNKVKNCKKHFMSRCIKLCNIFFLFLSFLVYGQVDHCLRNADSGLELTILVSVTLGTSVKQYLGCQFNTTGLVSQKIQELLILGNSTLDKSCIIIT